MNDNTEFLLKLLHEYQKDKLEDKYNLILRTLKKSEVYVNKMDFLITIESDGKHHFPIYLSLSDEGKKSKFFDKIEVESLLGILERENKESDYKIDDLWLERKTKDNLVIKLEEIINI